MTRRSKRKIVPVIGRDGFRPSSDLAEQFREWQRLRKLVNDLEKQAAQRAKPGSTSSDQGAQQ
jgi:hypothetical protein